MKRGGAARVVEQRERSLVLTEQRARDAKAPAGAALHARVAGFATEGLPALELGDRIGDLAVRFSTTGTPIVGDWALSAATLETDGLAGQASCSDDEPVWSGGRRERSTDAALSAFQNAFDSRTAGGTWSGKRYAQP